MKKPRIVVTGLGVVSCFGQDVNKFYQNLLEGKSGVRMITEFPIEEFSTKFAATVQEHDTEGYIDKKQARRIDKFISYTIVSGKKALEMADLGAENLAKLNKERCGVIIGSGMGGMDVFSEGVNTLQARGPKKVTPFFVPFILTNMGGALLAMDLGFMGPNYSVSTACATANNSIIAAVNHLRLGDADLMICGGVEGAITPIGIAGFSACKALSQRNNEPQKASRPWDRDRDGFVMGEGSGVLVLETLEHALNRGAPILAEYLGHGLTCDAYHMTEPRPDGLGVARCIRNALHDAGISAEEINYINAHGTSTPAGDMTEVNAMKQVFKKPENIAMNATKSMTGHCLGAAGGIEAVVTVKAIMDGVIHPTINLDNPEPDLQFRTPTKAEELVVNAAISNSFGFGGHNSSVIFGRYRG